MAKSDSGFQPDRFTPASVGVVAACALGNFVSSAPMVNATFGTFLRPITLEFGWSRTEFTAVLTMLSLVGVIAYPLGGKAADHFGARRVALLGAVAFSASMSLLYFVPRNPLVFYGLYLLVGLTAALPSTVVLSKVASSWFVRRRGMILGLTAGCGISLGYMFLPKASEAMIETVGWRHAYLGLAAIMAGVGLPVMALWLREAPDASARGAGPAQEPADGLTFAEARATARFWILLAAIALGTGGLAAFSVHEVAYAEDRGLGPGIAIGAIMAGALANGLWQIVIGRLLDAMPTPRIAAPMVLSSLAGLSLIVLTANPWLWMVGGFLTGVGSGSEYGLVPYALHRYFGRRAYGEIYGVVFGAVMLSMGFFPLAAAIIDDRFGSYDLAFAGVAACSTICGLLLLCLPRYEAAGQELARDARAMANKDVAPDLSEAAASTR
ncbi:MAG: MFS transporter [Caulobacteraceae bacterium]|nr:MFS transporter [Caulobacteraceae bacterium]